MTRTRASTSRLTSSNSRCPTSTRRPSCPTPSTGSRERGEIVHMERAKDVLARHIAHSAAPARQGAAAAAEAAEDSATTHSNGGAAAHLRGDLATARREYEAALAIDP